MSDTVVATVAPQGVDATNLDEVTEPERAPIRIGPKRRVVLPADACRLLGIDVGDELVVVVEDDVMQLMTPETAIKRLQAMFADVSYSSDDLIAERRAEAARERAEAADDIARARDRNR